MESSHRKDSLCPIICLLLDVGYLVDELTFVVLLKIRRQARVVPVDIVQLGAIRSLQRSRGMYSIVHNRCKVGSLHVQVRRRDESRAGLSKGNGKVVCQIHSSEFEHDGGCSRVSSDVAMLSFVKIGELDSRWCKALADVVARESPAKLTS